MNIFASWHHNVILAKAQNEHTYTIIIYQVYIPGTSIAFAAGILETDL
jgi:hypothetical protein